MTESTASEWVPDPHSGRGRYFEELTVGEIIRHPVGRTMTQADNVFFTTMTMNPAPAHLDESVEPFNGRLVNGLLTLGLVLGLSVYDLTLNTSAAMLALTDVKFLAPVYHGDSVHAETEVVELRPSGSRPECGIVTFLHRGVNQDGVTVLVATRVQLMLRGDTVTK